MKDSTEVVTLLSKCRNMLRCGKFNRHDVEFIKETLEEMTIHTTEMLERNPLSDKLELLKIGGLAAMGKHLIK